MSKSPSEPLKFLISHKPISILIPIKIVCLLYSTCLAISVPEMIFAIIVSTIFCTNKTVENKNELFLIDVYLPVAETQLTEMSYNSIERWCDARCYLRLLVTLSLSLFLLFHQLAANAMRCRL